MCGNVSRIVAHLNYCMSIVMIPSSYFIGDTNEPCYTFTSLVHSWPVHFIVFLVVGFVEEYCSLQRHLYVFELPL